MHQQLKNVEEFWNHNLCGHEYVQAKYLSGEFFEQYREFRYNKEHHLNHIVDWKSATNKSVLEIGLGIGADASRWAKYAKSYTGRDLTQESVLATRQHFKFLGLEGNIDKGNAEELGFEDGQFDIVYSHGVLHHTPNIRAALTEINRVLKPDGIFILMLYTKNSFNYWLRIQFYFRIRFLLELTKSRYKATNDPVWANHLANFRRLGWTYFSWDNWPHRCTDGPDCEVANIYWKREIIRSLTDAGFQINRMEKTHFPVGLRSKKMERKLANLLGFFQFAWATKANGDGLHSDSVIASGESSGRTVHLESAIQV